MVFTWRVHFIEHLRIILFQYFKYIFAPNHRPKSRKKNESNQFISAARFVAKKIAVPTFFIEAPSKTILIQWKVSSLNTFPDWDIWWYNVERGGVRGDSPTRMFSQLILRLFHFFFFFFGKCVFNSIRFTNIQKKKSVLPLTIWQN